MTDDLPLVSPEDHQATRLAATPALYKLRHEQLAVELALHTEEPEAIFARYGYTPDSAAVLLESPGFAKMLAKVSTELQDGLSFKIKVRAIAEDLLPFAHEIATDPTAPASVRADLMKWAAKVSGYEPVAGKDDGKQGGGLSLTIQFAGQAPASVLKYEPVTIEQ